MNRLYFDLETKKNPDALEFLPEPTAPGNLKDTEKIAAAILGKRNEMLERAALDPDYGLITSFGYAISSDDKDYVVVLTEEVGEKFLLEQFWKVYDTCGGMCVGFNILSFDIPYIMRRSMAYGIKHPLVPNLAKYRTEPITDLYPVLYGWQPGKSLKQVAKLYGLCVIAPDVDGSMVDTMTKEELVKYQTSDVFLVQQLYNKMNGVYFMHNDSFKSHRDIVAAQHQRQLLEEGKDPLTDSYEFDKPI